MGTSPKSWTRARPGRLLPACAMLFALALPAAAQEAQETSGAPPPDAAEVEALADQIEARVNALRAAGQERDEAIEFLTRQVEQAIGNLATEREEKADLQQTNADLNWRIESLVEARTELSEELTRTSEEHDESVGTLEAQVADLTQLLESEQDEKAELIAERDALAAQLAAIDKDREALDEALAEAEKTASKRQQAIVAREEEIERLGAELAALRDELESVTGELESVTGKLTDSREEIERKEKDLAALKKRLNVALASQVEELSQFRSEFFGRLRKAIGDHPDMRVEGDRFVFQSEVLFETGSAELGAAGKQQLVRLARTLKEIAAGIPDDLRWVLRVDGHTDRRSINTSDYPSNWELSAARALTVVHFLIEQGIPPRRLAATGFGEYQPIDPANDEIAYRRNRRIEFKLTQR